jgi:O-antigen ligase
MIKLAIYLLLTLFGILAGFFNPVAGGVSCILGYLFNPAALELPVSGIQYQQYVSIAFLAGVIMKWRPALPPVGKEGNVLIFLWAFTAIAITSASWAVYSQQVALMQVFELFKTILFATLLQRVIRSERHVRILGIAFAVGILHAGLMHVLGHRLGFVGSAHIREYGVLPDGQTSVMLLFIPLLLIMAATGKGFERILAFVTLPVALDSLIGTYQRAALVGVVGEIALLVFLGGYKTDRLLAPRFLVGGVLVLFRCTPDDYWAWMSTIMTPTQEASANSRLVINKASARMFLDHPILGVGYRNYIFMAHLYLPEAYLTDGHMRAAHNSFFTVLCETGLFGFIAWIGGLGMSVVLLRRIRKGRDGGPKDNVVALYALGMEVGLYGWMINGCFVSEHEVDPAYWFMALAIAMVRVQHQLKLSSAEGVSAGASKPGTIVVARTKTRATAYQVVSAGGPPRLQS